MRKLMLLLVFAIIAFLSWSILTPLKALDEETNLVIALSGDVQGYLEECG